VSLRVGNVKNNDPSLIEPIAPEKTCRHAIGSEWLSPDGPSATVRPANVIASTTRSVSGN
jgi:hypothetical protein